jgi:hypothetical protein
MNQSTVVLPPEISLAIHQALQEAAQQLPKAAFSAVWDRAKKDNPELFGKLQAYDWMADDEAERRDDDTAQATYVQGGLFVPLS